MLLASGPNTPLVWSGCVASKTRVSWNVCEFIVNCEGSIPSRDYSNHNYVWGQAELKVAHIWKQSKQSIETAQSTSFFCTYFMLTGELGEDPQVKPIGCIQPVFHTNITNLENKGKNFQIAPPSLSAAPGLQTTQDFHMRWDLPWASLKVSPWC